MQSSEKIGVATATIISMNAVIGSGIFSTPAALATHVGPAGILAYGLVIVCIWCIAVSFARLAHLFPGEGSFYTYVYPWAGHVGGMIACSAYLGGLSIAMALIAHIAGLYVHTLIPQFSAYLLGIIILSILILANLFSIKLSEWGQRILIVCTVFPLIATTLLCLTNIHWEYLTPFAPYGFTNILKATRIVIFGFFGFESALSLYSIVENPEKNVPRALTYSIILVGTLYLLFITSIILSTPPALFNNQDLLVTDLLRQTFPDKTWLVGLIHGAIVSAIIGTIHAMIWGASSLLCTVLKKVRSKPLSVITHPIATHHRLAVLCISGFIMFNYIAINNLGLFFNITAFFVVFAYILALISLLIVRAEWHPKKIGTTLLGIATATVIFFFAGQGILEEVAKII